MVATYPFAKIPGAGYLRKVVRTRGWPYVVSWVQRISGILLVFYVGFHVITLSTLRNPEVFESKMKFFAALIPSFLEWFLAVPVIFHALNGGRLILYEIYGNRRDRVVLKWVIAVSVFYLVLLAIFMLLGNQSVSAVFFWVYMASISSFITYLTVTKLNHSRASIFWKMQRLSGAFLLLMLPAHMLYMHLDPVVGRDAQLIIARMDNGFIKLIDLLLISTVLYHGAYGLLGICRDYLASRRVQLICGFSIAVVMTLLAWVGVRLIFLVG